MVNKWACNVARIGTEMEYMSVSTGAGHGFWTGVAVTRTEAEDWRDWGRYIVREHQRGQ